MDYDFYTHENKTKWHVAPKRQRGAAAKHLVKPLTAQRCSHRLNHSTIEPLNQKSQIAREYGLLPADTNCHPVKLPLQTKERSRYVRLLWKQNLWMATNWKRYLKSEFALFSDVVNLIPISFNFSNVGDIFWGWDPKRTYLSLEKEKIVKRWSWTFEDALGTKTKYLCQNISEATRGRRECRNANGFERSIQAL